MRPLVGLFDSGLGGLSVARAILGVSPDCALFVVGDTVHVPYGGRALDEVQRFALTLTDYLIEAGCSAVVMACNISSAVALDEARRRYPGTPIFGMIEAGAQNAIEAGEKDLVGVLATKGTVDSGAYVRSLTRLVSGISVVQSACPDFVPLVESGAWNSPEALVAAQKYVEPLATAGCRTVILGCTHYPFLESAIRAAFPYDVTLIDPALTVAMKVHSVIQADHRGAEAGRIHCEATSDPGSFMRRGSLLLGRPIQVTHCAVWVGYPASGAGRRSNCVNIPSDL